MRCHTWYSVTANVQPLADIWLSCKVIAVFIDVGSTIRFYWTVMKFEKHHCHSGVLLSAKRGCTLQYNTRSILVVSFSNWPSRHWKSCDWNFLQTNNYIYKFLGYLKVFFFYLFEVIYDQTPKNWYSYWSIKKINLDTRVKDWQAVIILQIELYTGFSFT